MKVLVDTPVWSALLRRRSPNSPEADELSRLVREDRAVLLGMVRLEILSGLEQPVQFERVRRSLAFFGDIATTAADHERAAEFSNKCRRAGIQGSSVDFLICATAASRLFTIYTTDLDFKHFAKILPIELHRPIG